MEDLRKRVLARARKVHEKTDEPWGTTLALVLAADEPDLLAMLVDENLDPTSYHAGAERYFAAWVRLDAVIAAELALVAEDEERSRLVRKAMWDEKPSSVPLDHSEASEGLLPLPKAG